MSRWRPGVLNLGAFLAAAACGGGGPTTAEPAEAAPVSPRAVSEPAPSSGPETPGTERERGDLPVARAALEAMAEHERFRGWTLVPLLQVEREDIACVLVWRAFDPEGELASDDRVDGIVLLREDDGSWRIEGEPFDASFFQVDRAMDLLGGPDLHVHPRRAGVPLSVIGEQLAALPEAFAEAARAGRREDAVDHAVEFSRLYGAWSLQDNVSEAMLLVARGGIEVEPVGMAESPEAGQATLRVRITMTGEPPAETSLQVGRIEDSGLWVIGGPFQPGALPPQPMPPPSP